MCTSILMALCCSLMEALRWVKASTRKWRRPVSYSVFSSAIQALCYTDCLGESCLLLLCVYAPSFFHFHIVDTLLPPTSLSCLCRYALEHSIFPWEKFISVRAVRLWWPIPLPRQPRPLRISMAWPFFMHASRRVYELFIPFNYSLFGFVRSLSSFSSDSICYYAIRKPSLFLACTQMLTNTLAYTYIYSVSFPFTCRSMSGWSPTSRGEKFLLKKQSKQPTWTASISQPTAFTRFIDLYV